MKSLTVVKLGGSLITNKDKPVSANVRAMRSVARATSSALKQQRIRLLLIHGGGSFGHYYASHFNVSTTEKNIPCIGVSRIASAMISLHSMVLRELINCGVNCRTFLPSELIQEPGGSILPSTLRRLESLLEIGCIPITFGDIVTSRRGSRIVSGDEIALELARKLGVQRTIFAMDVDGIYSDSSLKGPLVRELVNAREIKASARRYDVTGGIDAKIKIGFELAKLGSDVFFVNGKRESRLQKLLLGDSNTPLTRILSKNIST